ncbi:MAG: hypothetical protein IJV75_00155 [Alphaproteobacteria bacterium]|nr:hypothetical protein [Alphaproteobacteria bacterium]
MKEGDTEANVAYYCLHKLRITPRQWEAMDRYEQAFIIAAIQVKIENDKQQEKKAKANKKRKR